MPDPTLLPAIKAAIQANELGAISPYVLCFAGLSQSGASFGIFQGDTNVNATARSVLRQALVAADTDDATCDRIISALSQPCPQNPLSPEDTTLADNALSSDAGKALVDAMDSKLLQIVLADLDSSITAAASRTLTLAPAVQLYICLWSNMTGAPTTLNHWLAGTTELGVAPPAGPVVSRPNVEAYLQSSSYFQLHPRNFLHMSDSVDTGLLALPVA
jgi:hypothetical protein